VLLATTTLAGRAAHALSPAEKYVTTVGSSVIRLANSGSGKAAMRQRFCRSLPHGARAPTNSNGTVAARRSHAGQPRGRQIDSDQGRAWPRDSKLSHCPGSRALQAWNHSRAARRRHEARLELPRWANGAHHGRAHLRRRCRDYYAIADDLPRFAGSDQGALDSKVTEADPS